MQERDKMVEDVMDNFDFEIVHKVMLMLDWSWVAHRQGFSGVPDVCAIRKTARTLLYNSLEKKMPISSGGFQVDIENVNGVVQCLSLSFVVSEYASEKE